MPGGKCYTYDGTILPCVFDRYAKVCKHHNLYGYADLTPHQRKLLDKYYILLREYNILRDHVIDIEKGEGEII